MIMNVTKARQGAKLTVTVEGRLDTLASPDLEEALDPELEGLEELVFDMTGLIYISSAGLRVLLNAAQVLERQNGKMSTINVSENLREIFEITGLENDLGVEYNRA